ncbi:hypothetical protein [Alcanivorax sp. 24]|uniref:hypothetical protein n=1 Tax=Alcanivorax sp. 24 TaxID=2545266 RepID=UPI001060AD17|nr:hypothetical protein [Alcanivorax sp. 24]
MSRWGRFLCDECGDFFPDSMMSEEENVCYGCFDVPEHDDTDDGNERDYDDDDDFEDPFAD